MDDDVLGSGTEPSRSGRRFPRWLSVAVTVALGGIMLVLAFRDGGPSNTHDRQSARPSPTPSWPPTFPTLRQYRTPVYRLVGATGPGPAGLRLVVAGSHPGILDAATGRMTSLDGTQPDINGAVWLEKTAAGIAVTRYSPSSGSTQGYLWRGGHELVRLGPVSGVLAAMNGGLYTVDCPSTENRGCRLSLRSASGTVRWTRTLAPANYPVRDTPYGLLVSQLDDQGSGPLVLQDPRTGVFKRHLGPTSYVLAASDEQAAFTRPNCFGESCPLVVVKLATGEQHFYRLPRGGVSAGTFSPDGRWLALGFLGLHEQDRTPTEQRDGFAGVLNLKTVLNLESTRFIRVPGMTTGAKTAPYPVWGPGGTVVLATGEDGNGRIVVWRPSDPRVTVLPVRLQSFYPGPGSLLVLP